MKTDRLVDHTAIESLATEPYQSVNLIRPNPDPLIFQELVRRTLHRINDVAVVKQSRPFRKSFLAEIAGSLNSAELTQSASISAEAGKQVLVSIPEINADQWLDIMLAAALDEIVDPCGGIYIRQGSGFCSVKPGASGDVIHR